MKNEEKGRISARVPMAVQETIQRAADLTGVTVNSFLVQTVLRQAEEVIDRYEIKRIALSEQDSAWFLEQLVTPSSPNENLRAALAAYKETLHGDNPAIGASP